MIRKMQNIVFLNLKCGTWFFITFRNASDLWIIPNMGFSHMDQESLGRKELILCLSRTILSCVVAAILLVPFFENQVENDAV